MPASFRFGFLLEAMLGKMASNLKNCPQKSYWREFHLIKAFLRLKKHYPGYIFFFSALKPSLLKGLNTLSEWKNPQKICCPRVICQVEATHILWILVRLSSTFYKKLRFIIYATEATISYWRCYNFSIATMSEFRICHFLFSLLVKSILFIINWSHKWW